MKPGQLYLSEEVMKPGQLYLSEDKHWQQLRWAVILITKLEKPQYGYLKNGKRSKNPLYQMVRYDIIAHSENYYHDPERTRSFATSSLFACELKRLSRKDLPLYIDGKVTPKFEELLKRR
jgi:hypothetical protein